MWSFIKAAILVLYFFNFFLVSDIIISVKGIGNTDEQLKFEQSSSEQLPR